MRWAAFLVESYKQLLLSSSNIVSLLLSQISQQIVALHGCPSVSIPSGLPGQDFQLSTSAIRVNILWRQFTSLVLSLTCALFLATQMQLWVPRYLQTSQRWYGPHKRAQIYEPFSRKVSRDSVIQVLSKPLGPMISLCDSPYFLLLYLTPAPLIQPRLSEHFQPWLCTSCLRHSDPPF
jgi:hypothetical protein